MTFTTPPPQIQGVLVTFPAPHVLLVTLDLEKRMNAIPARTSFDMDKLWNWFGQELEL
jgi:hypothetical protein